MRNEEIEELSALRDWLSSFPQLEQATSDKENSSSPFENEGDYLSNPAMKR